MFEDVKLFAASASTPSFACKSGLEITVVTFHLLTMRFNIFDYNGILYVNS